MPSLLFQHIDAAMRERGLFIVQRDATGRMCIYPKIRIIAALCILVHRMFLDQADEFCQICEKTNRKSFLAFVNKVVIRFPYKYLRYKKDVYLKQILSIKDTGGFYDVCIDRGDCKHWQWKNLQWPWPESSKDG